MPDGAKDAKGTCRLCICSPLSKVPLLLNVKPQVALEIEATLSTTTPERVALLGRAGTAWRTVNRRARAGTAWNGQAPQPGAVVVDKNQAKRKAPKQAKQKRINERKKGVRPR